MPVSVSNVTTKSGPPNELIPCVTRALGVRGADHDRVAEQRCNLGVVGEVRSRVDRPAQELLDVPRWLVGDRRHQRMAGILEWLAADVGRDDDNGGHVLWQIGQLAVQTGLVRAATSTSEQEDERGREKQDEAPTHGPTLAAKSAFVMQPLEHPVRVAAWR